MPMNIISALCISNHYHRQAELFNHNGAEDLYRNLRRKNRDHAADGFCLLVLFEFGGIGGPDSADRIFVTKPIRDCWTWIIGEVPVYVRRTRRAAAWHLQIA